VSAAIEESIEVARTSADDDLDHIYCDCDPDLGLCGSDISAAIFIGDDEQLDFLCLVCDDLADDPCPRCGA